MLRRCLSIRKAQKDDCEFVVMAVRKMTQFIMRTEPLPVLNGIEETFQNMIDDQQNNIIFVAEDEKSGNKLGAAVCTFQNALHLGGKYLYLQELVVEDEARGKGVGSKLLNHVENFSKEQGFVAVDLAQPPNETNFHEQRTKFYTRNGYEIGGISRMKAFREWLK